MSSASTVNIDCCNNGITEACDVTSDSWTYVRYNENADDCTKTTTVTAADGTQVSSDNTIVDRVECCLEGYTLVPNDSALLLACTTSTTYVYTAPVVADPDLGVVEVLELCEATTDSL